MTEDVKPDVTVSDKAAHETDVTDITNTRSKGWRQYAKSDEAPSLRRATVSPFDMHLMVGSLEVTLTAQPGEKVACGCNAQVKINGKEVAATRLLIELVLDDVPRVELDYYPTME